MVDKSLLNRIADSKSYYSAFAISIIILSHLVVVDSSLPLVKIFTPGFIGVDIFLFYSGYTLGFSYTRRTTKDFYLQRIKRILPMFLVFATLSSLVHVVKGEHISLLDWACNLSTLSYYGLGGFAIDWYLSSIFLFYLAYPLLFAFVEKARTGGGNFVERLRVMPYCSC